MNVSRLIELLKLRTGRLTIVRICNKVRLVKMFLFLWRERFWRGEAKFLNAVLKREAKEKFSTDSIYNMNFAIHEIKLN